MRGVRAVQAELQQLPQAVAGREALLALLRLVDLLNDLADQRSGCGHDADVLVAERARRRRVEDENADRVARLPQGNGDGGLHPELLAPPAVQRTVVPVHGDGRPLRGECDLDERQWLGGGAKRGPLRFVAVPVGIARHARHELPVRCHEHARARDVELPGEMLADHGEQLARRACVASGRFDQREQDLRLGSPPLRYLPAQQHPDRRRDSLHRLLSGDRRRRLDGQDRDRLAHDYWLTPHRVGDQLAGERGNLVCQLRGARHDARPVPHALLEWRDLLDALVRPPPHQVGERERGLLGNRHDKRRHQPRGGHVTPQEDTARAELVKCHLAQLLDAREFRIRRRSCPI